MRLVDLEPEFMVCTADDGSRLNSADGIATAQGIWFLCPKCYAERGSNRGCHGILVWFADRGVPAGAQPAPDRWTVTGTGFADLTLNPSVHLTGPGCGWHGWIRNGDAS